MSFRGARLADQSFILVLCTGAISFALHAQPACEDLKSTALTDATVVSATSEKAGMFVPPVTSSDAPEAKVYKDTPSFCRVVIASTPAKDSRIIIEVWMPLERWNGKFRGQGNGGFAGALDYRGMAGSVSNGYATAGTDAGHKGEAEDASWALGHPDKVVDFGYRAIHEMTVNAKKIVGEYYSRQPSRAYFDACSDGGREALMEAQRFPADYDGILAGAPANDWTHLLSGSLEVEKTLTSREENYIPPEKLPLITEAVLAACDAQDGVRDGILNDPRKCHFNPKTLLCGNGKNQECLSGPQVDSLERIYAGGKTSGGESIFPGLMPSGEDGEGGWKNWVMGISFAKSSGAAYVTGFFRDMVYENPSWNLQSANADEALQAANRTQAKTLNSTDPNLRPFEERGGKMILYHGWLDPAISPLNTIHYYGAVLSAMSEPVAQRFVRLYMVPGMRHCAGGPGPYMFGQLGIGTARDPEHSVFAALEQWVENGRAPTSIVATKLNDDHNSSSGVRMTRPLCPYPQIARYTGRGSSNESANFVCANPEP